MEGACKLPTVRVWNLDERYKAKSDKQGHCTGERDLRGLLGCLYVMRCNLYHGGKAAGNPFDLILCDAGYQVLASLLVNYTWK
jgi:hypothetical protein